MTVETTLGDPVSVRSKLHLASKPTLYTVIVLTVVLAVFAYHLRTEGIFACQANGYSPDRYLSYCHSNGYGDYEHGAFWFGLEPSINNFASKASVLFLGSSRMQIAFSSNATSSWFSSAAAPYYLMGFGYDENVVFTSALLQKIEPEARVYVINIEGFFVDSKSIPARTVMDEGLAKKRYRAKRLWQSMHKSACGKFPMICGDNYVIFRSRAKGDFSVSSTHHFQSIPVSYEQHIDPIAAQVEIAIGKEFISRLPVNRECIVLTSVPHSQTKAAYLNAIADGLGIDLVMPDVAGLETFDGSHLDRSSAERWSYAFFEAAGPQILKCLNDSRLETTS